MDQSIRVLVLEDDTTMRELLEEVLRDRGYQVVAAARGEEALSQARAEPFDLIVADIRMDGMSGLDAIEEAKRLQPELGSIVISGYASEEETLRAVRLNVGGYLKKPFKMQELLARINDFVARRSRQRRQAQELREMREAFEWSLESLGVLGDRLFQAQVGRAGELAQIMARQLGLAGEVAGQVRFGAMLRLLEELAGLDVPLDLPGLSEALGLGLPASVASFAAQATREPDTAVEAADERLRSAYAAVAGGHAAPPGEEEVARPTGLLALGRVLEQAGDLEGARVAYLEMVSQSGVSAEGVQALLGMARIAVARAQTAGLEEAVTRLLAQAEQLGPVTLALAELEAGELLAAAGHGASAKLLQRAVDSLGRVRLPVPQARAVLELARLDKCEPAQVDRALDVVADPIHLLEVSEQLTMILPGVLELASRDPESRAARLSARLVRDFPGEVARLARRSRLSPGAREVVLGVLEADQDSVPADLLEILSNDPDPDLRARALGLAGRLSGEAVPPVLRIYALGSLDVYLGEHRVDDSNWKTQKTRFLFAYLAAQSGRPVVVDTILEEFWPGPLENARNNLYTATSSIRKALRPPELETAPDPVLREKETILLNPTLPRWHDVEELQKAHDTGRRCLQAGQVEQAMTHFSRVARLYRGPYLDGCYMEWALQRRTTLEHMATDALQRLVTHRLDQERYREALEYAVKLLAVRPDSQEGHHAKMRAHLGLGEPEQAIKQFEICQKMLAEMFDAEPTTDVLRTYHQARYGLGGSPSTIG